MRFLSTVFVGLARLCAIFGLLTQRHLFADHLEGVSSNIRD